MSTELRAGADEEDVSVRATVRALGLAELGRASKLCGMDRIIQDGEKCMEELRGK